MSVISIHAPREGGDSGDRSEVCHTTNFNPRPPRGGRHYRIGNCWLHGDFNPRPPRGGRPQTRVPYWWIMRFQSTPPARGATAYDEVILGATEISIHAPREGGDQWCCDRVHRSHYFNPRPPRGGRLPLALQRAAVMAISIHAPREGGDRSPSTSHPSLCGFQSTPPARGATLAACLRDNYQYRFQSTPPARGATSSFMEAISQD